MILPTSPPIYQGDGFKDLMNTVQVAIALSDPVCLRGLLACAASHLSSVKLNVLPPWDWKRREQVNQGMEDAFSHMSEGIRLLNQRFEDPKQALTAASLFGAALLGMCAVSGLSELRI
jgi:hypothetical protein